MNTLFRRAHMMVLAFAATSAYAQFDFGITSLSAPQRPDGVCFADFDGDGDLDMAVTTDNPDKVSVYFNSGTGAFSVPVNFPMGAGTGPGAIGAADFDGDGDRDIAVALHNANQVSILTNNGFGSFTLGWMGATGADPNALVIGQLTGNALPDVVTANRDSDNVTILTNTGTGFTSTNVAVQLDPRAVAVGDLGTDGSNEIIVTNHDSRSITVLKSGLTGFAVLAHYGVGSTVRPSGIACRDIDADGDSDVVVATSDTAINRIAVFRSDGITLVGPTNYNIGGVNGDSVALGDFDSDGEIDAAVSNQDSNNISVLPNLGNGTFGTAQLFALGVRPGSIAVGDVDADIDLDLAIANRDSDTVSMLRNNKVVGQFVSPSSFSMLRGSIVSGGLTSVLSSDDDRLTMRPGATPFSSESPIQVRLQATAPSATVSTMRFLLESKSQIGNAQQTVYLFNFVSNNWVQVDQRIATLDDTAIEIAVPTPQPFVQTGTSTMLARITWRAFGGSSVFPWNASIDRVAWILTP